MSTPRSHPSPRGWHSRGYLPHFEAGDEVIQSLTFRLADTLPRSLLEAWRNELAVIESARRETELRLRIERELDAGCGPCWLADSQLADLVENAMLHFDGERYRLLAWVVMPNHVHALIQPFQDHSLSQIVGSWKSFTATLANRYLGRVGRFWQADYFDRFIRDDVHYEQAKEYIEMNPVKAGLCDLPADWPWSSASRRK